MTDAPFRYEPLSPQHDRRSFDCGNDDLNRYFHQQVSQDERRLVTRCYVAVEQATEVVVGYYTLSATGVGFTDLSSEQARGLPRYPLVPGLLLGRLAVSRAWQGRGLGEALVWNAVRRGLEANVGAAVVLVEAIDAQAAAFYRHIGFEPLAKDALQLVLMLRNVK